MFLFPLNYVLSFPPFVEDYFSMILDGPAFTRDYFAMKTYIEFPVSYIKLTDLLFECLNIIHATILLFSL